MQTTTKRLPTDCGSSVTLEMELGDPTKTKKRGTTVVERRGYPSVMPG
jgi:hypothetical protein